MSDYPSLPVIRVELETLRQSMVHAFAQQQLHLDDMFQRAIDAALDPVLIQKELNNLAQHYLSAAIADAVKHYFNYGKGRETVRKVINERLDEMLQ